MTLPETLFSSPYRMARPEKEVFLSAALSELTEHHRQVCPPYAAMLDAMNCPGDIQALCDIPFLPVGLFKTLTLKSVPDETVKTIVTSSGTSGQAVSRIFLDAETAALQQRALVAIVSDFLGPTRLPMLIIDCPSVLSDRRKFTARGAGILGFSLFGSKRCFALDEQMNLDEDALSAFLDETRGEAFFAFGFTYLVWHNFYGALARSRRRFDLSKGTLIHGGGWKKLIDQAISPNRFKRALSDVCGLTRVRNYYGMAEQTGSIFMECAEGHLHCSDFSDVIVRRAVDFAPCPPGKAGILQVLSVLPRSYPGHSLLTEDEAVLLGVDDCPCGRKGTYFSVCGRLKSAELRGCSDVYTTGL